MVKAEGGLVISFSYVTYLAQVVVSKQHAKSQFLTIYKNLSDTKDSTVLGDTKNTELNHERLLSTFTVSGHFLSKRSSRRNVFRDSFSKVSCLGKNAALTILMKFCV